MSTPPSAWTISAAMAAAQSALSRLEASGDVDTDEAAALAVLREEAPDVDVVVTRLLRAMGEAGANADAIEQRVGDLQARANRFLRQHAEYRRTVFAMLDALGVRKWSSPEFTVSVQDGRAGVVITDPAALPDQFVRIKREPDKTAIGCALREGHEVAGAELQNTMPSLVVRAK